MEAKQILILLEEEWDNLKQQLGQAEFSKFRNEYTKIISSLPEDPDWKDLEKTVDKICELMILRPYTNGLLRGCRCGGKERLLASAGETIRDREPVNQVCNRFRLLIDKSVGKRIGKADHGKKR